jgi:hypothetical protein
VSVGVVNDRWEYKKVSGNSKEQLLDALKEIIDGANIKVAPDRNPGETLAEYFGSDMFGYMIHNLYHSPGKGELFEIYTDPENEDGIIVGFADGTGTRMSFTNLPFDECESLRDKYQKD